MKKFILAAVVASMVATPALAEPQRGGNGRNQPVSQAHRPAPAPQRVAVRPAPQPQYRAHWQRGQRFDARQARNYRQIDYRQHRGMRAPPRGYRYVQSGNDAVLVSVTTGIIAAILLNALR